MLFAVAIESLQEPTRALALKLALEAMVSKRFYKPAFQDVHILGYYHRDCRGNMKLKVSHVAVKPAASSLGSQEPERAEVDVRRAKAPMVNQFYALA